MAEMEKPKRKRAATALVVALLIGISGFVYGTSAFILTSMNPSQQGAQNQPPSLAGCSITPSSAYKTTTLTAVPSGASDPDGDSVTCFYRWYKNGELIPSQLGNTLAPSYFVKGDSITVQIIPYDGKQAGTARNGSTTILNSAPSLGYSSVTPTNPNKLSTLQALPGSYSDADGDAPSYYYRWFRNGNRISGASTSSYVLSGANYYDEFWAEIKPFDGTANGTAANSSHAVVRWSFGGGYCAPSYNDTELFVSSVSGVDAVGYGNQTHPCETITYGIAQALATGKARVVVAQGAYNESVDLVGGISVLGGYSQDFELFNAIELRAEVWATSQRWTLRGVGIENQTRVEGLVIHGPMIATPGVSSYGIYLSDCNASLVIRNCTILGGAGGSGAAGTTGTNGQDGNGGSDGLGARPYPGSGMNAGGAGGVLVIGIEDISGGTGGTANYSAYNTQQQAGQIGQGTGGGMPGPGGWNFLLRTNGIIEMPAGPIDGQNGLDGAYGTDGFAGSRVGTAQGTVIAGDWVASAGNSGTDGQNGGGGGGGGGGGCQFNQTGLGWLGGSGGGGGSGGWLGTSGGGGGGGGGAICVFVHFSAMASSLPAIYDCDIFLGGGGDGGDGGAGGRGGMGGGGGTGGVSPGLYLPEALVGRGGDGGNGGDGGSGGSGAGGNGGCSLGFLTYNAGTPSYSTGNTITTSTGFAGGGGGGGVGTIPGQSGFGGTCQSTLYL